MRIEEYGIEDRRAFERFSARFPVRFKANGHDYGANVSLRNASALGAMITTTQRLYLNDSVALEVALPDCKVPMTLKGQVVWAVRDESGMWDIGLKFHTIDLVHMSRLYKFVVPTVSSV